MSPTHRLQPLEAGTETALPCTLCGMPGVCSQYVELSPTEAGALAADFILVRLCARCLECPQETKGAVESLMQGIARRASLLNARN